MSLLLGFMANTQLSPGSGAEYTYWDRMTVGEMRNSRDWSQLVENVFILARDGMVQEISRQVAELDLRVFGVVIG